MRSLLKDSGRLMSIVSATVLGSVSSGNGMFSDGTPWVMTRTATGFYKINFDPQLIPISGSGMALANALLCEIYAFAPGQILVLTTDLAAASVNTDYKLMLNCLDSRV